MPTGFRSSGRASSPSPGRFDQTALDTYRRMLEGLHAAGIEPLVTLHHFTSPAWLADRGGWANPDVVPRLADYADRVGAQPGRSGALVGHDQRAEHPRAQGVPRRQLAAASAGGPARLPAADAPRRARPRAGAPGAQGAPARRAWPAWRSRSGRCSRCAGGARSIRLMARRRRLGVAGPGARPHAADARLDRRQLLQPHAGRLALAATRRPSGARRTDFGWEIYPTGLYDVLRRVGRYGKPVVITENGIADADDDQRPAYIVAHLRQAQRAIADGVDLRGYMHWSLLDNFEWAEGYAQASAWPPATACCVPAPACTARSPARTNYLRQAASVLLEVPVGRDRRAAGGLHVVTDQVIGLVCAEALQYGAAGRGVCEGRILGYQLAFLAGGWVTDCVSM